MSYTEADLERMLKGIRYDATAIQAKVTELLTALATLDLPERDTPSCPACGVPAARLVEHLRNVHGIEEAA